MNETRDSRIIVIFSGGRSCWKTISCGLILPGDIVRLQSYIRYWEFENAMQKVRDTMTAAIQPVVKQFEELTFNTEYRESLRNALQFFETALYNESNPLSELKEKICEMYYPKDPLPRPHKIISAFNVHEAYKGRLNYKPVYYHCRNNC